MIVHTGIHSIIHSKDDGRRMDILFSPHATDESIVAKQKARVVVSDCEPVTATLNVLPRVHATQICVDDHSGNPTRKVKLMKLIVVGW
jgi:hypothetical protein